MLFREKSWPIAPGEESSGLALDNDTHRLFSVCSNKLMVVVDALDGHVVTILPIGDGYDGVKFDPGMKRAYSSKSSTQADHETRFILCNGHSSCQKIGRFFNFSFN